MKKLLFAPMATLSHEAMRLTLESCSPSACDEYYTEMIQATSCLNGGKFEPFYLRTAPDSSRLVWQLTCGKAQPLAECAAKVCALGGIGVDINMGCCAPAIVQQGAGIAWMLKPAAETEAMLRGVRRAMPEGMRLSVKMRLGDENYSESELLAFAEMLVGAGVRQIVLHPRTRKAKFKRTPDWNAAQKLCVRLKREYGDGVSFCVNGDISDAASLFAAARAVPQCDGFMVGRAAVQKPWIFARLKSALAQAECRGGTEIAQGEASAAAQAEAAPRRVDLEKIALDFLEQLQTSQPPEFWITRAQRFFAYYSANFSFAHYLATQINNARDLDGVRAAFLDYLAKQSGERFKLV